MNNNSDKPLLVFQTPLCTRSGYGDRGRDLARSLIQLYDKEYDVVFVPTRWGETSWDALEEGKDDDLLSRIRWDLQPFKPWPIKPDIFIQHTVPNEFIPIGTTNIGVTAGIETTGCSPEFIVGCNKMDMVIASSTHSKEVLEKPQQLQDGKVVQLQKPVKILFEGVDLSIFNKNKVDRQSQVYKELSSIVTESFAFLFVGHWLKGDMGQDRKDIGMLINCFGQAFNKKKNPPALVLKTSSATFSALDRDDITNRIKSIKHQFNFKNVNIYVIHGNLTTSEMNDLYNHPKVKANISIFKGEGFGRPLLEATTSGKPVIATDFSGPKDFLHPQYSIRLPYELTPIHPSATDDKFLLAGSKWATVNYNSVAGVMLDIFNNYENYLKLSRKHIQYTKDNFSLDYMTKELDKLVGEKIKSTPILKPLIMPKLSELKPITGKV